MPKWQTNAPTAAASSSSSRIEAAYNTPPPNISTNKGIKNNTAMVCCAACHMPANAAAAHNPKPSQRPQCLPNKHIPRHSHVPPPHIGRTAAC
uniref:Uncharacterized protein n=1 Tax=Conchiformibius kuhniae TaxID=211502 RepID=A0A8T9MRH3_9NEIS|nr:hypothetical protein LVJ77_06920 [Conchiformibius kuhniae]